MTDLVGKHGFEDGDALLSRTEDAYLRYAVQEAERALAEAERALARAGFTGYAGIFGTHHNPLRLSGDRMRGGVPVSAPDEALLGATMRLWAFDWSVLDEIAFWIA